MNTNLTFEEKIDAIYVMLRAQEARTHRLFWYRLLKWCIIIGIAYSAMTHPEYVVGKMTQYIQPIVMEQIQTMLEKQKNGIIDQAKKIITEQKSQQ